MRIFGEAWDPETEIWLGEKEVLITSKERASSYWGGKNIQGREYVLHDANILNDLISFMKM